MEMYRTATITISNYFDAVEKDYPIFKKCAKALEETIGIRSRYIMLGIVFVPLALLFMPILLKAFTIIYPVRMSVTSIEREEVARTRWLIYWVLFHTISVIESSFCGWALKLIPGYIIIKFIFFLWCMMPTPANGCDVVYYRLLQPVILKYIGAVDEHVDAISECVSHAVDGNKNFIANAIISQQTNRTDDPYKLQ